MLVGTKISNAFKYAGAFIKTDDHPLFQKKQKLADSYISREINAGKIITYS